MSCRERPSCTNTVHCPACRVITNLTPVDRQTCCGHTACFVESVPDHVFDARDARPPTSSKKRAQIYANAANTLTTAAFRNMVPPLLQFRNGGVRYPACFVSRVRALFPDANQQYTGNKF